MPLSLIAIRAAKYASQAAAPTRSAQVPLAELEGYESQLKSMTGGHGSYSIELSHYDPVPGDIQQKLQAAHKKQQHDS